MRVHNLQNVDLDLPLHQLIVFTGVSGSGKSSLAFDTLFVEGQRRYIECFSTYARQFFDQMEKPDADQIRHIPPAIAIRQSALSRSGRSTVGTQTEIIDSLRLLFGRAGELYCPDCDLPARQDSLQSCLELLTGLADGVRFQVAFPLTCRPGWRELLQAGGFQRVIVGGQTVRLEDLNVANGEAIHEAGAGTSDAGAPDTREPDTREPGTREPGTVEGHIEAAGEVLVVVDRLVAGRTDAARVADSLELAARAGRSRWSVLIADPDGSHESLAVDGQSWRLESFDAGRNCSRCGRDLPVLDPRLLSFNSPLGACPGCNGFGSVATISWHRIVPNPELSLAEGAIAPWNAPSYQHELEELLELADDYGVPVDVPFRELGESALRVIMEGVPERQFGGLRGFYAWLERKKYRMGVRAFLSRWRSYATCEECQGTRLQPMSRAARLAGLSICDVMSMSLSQLRRFIDQLRTELAADQLAVARLPLDEIQSRLDYLDLAGLDYLTLDRTIRTLSGGEAQRVALTSALGSKLVNTLFVLDEPTAGLHPQDTRRILQAVQLLRDRKNTVLVVEHESEFIEAADWIVDFGPGAGREGGRIVFSGPADELSDCSESLTAAAYCNAESTQASSALSLSGSGSGTGFVADSPEQETPRFSPSGWLKVRGITRHNLKSLDVEFPLGVLCAVTGVSGSGKSTLVNDTLYAAVARAMGQTVILDEAPWWQEVAGVDQLEDIQLVDQQPIGRSSRSNPVTYIKAFDEIRKLFAATDEARLRNLTPSSFSFNSASGGRCRRCEGQGQVEVDLHFLGDLSMTCPECHGTRFEPEILAVKYRGLTIAEMLELTVAEAFTLFRSESRLLRRLQVLRDVGLEYLPLGQPTSTLSGGEVQRLKLAGQLSGLKQKSRLLLLDEPTIGLHRCDIRRLVACLRRLVEVGYSVIVIEHDLDLIRAADYVIELGPGAGVEGGQVVASGQLSAVMSADQSLTARFLRDAARDRSAEAD